jgi:hypothetical protein
MSFSATRRHAAAEEGVEGLVDEAHSSGADEAARRVAAEAPANGEGARSHDFGEDLLTLEAAANMCGDVTALGAIETALDQREHQREHRVLAGARDRGG